MTDIELRKAVLTVRITNFAGDLDPADVAEMLDTNGIAASDREAETIAYEVNCVRRSVRSALQAALVAL
ncbi:hypothetical protein F5X71_34770 [Nocardia brasiliensis]|uniref:Uncharacterized protein n=1 Tax=Nocardia brasiliensis TaxID=37326 RepID=A0A6G9Y0Q5_NOCBR|nr:hypothetical protein [Nocardia brasiliensis]QIS06789.1 hypothetical protein F5X71_34770 [Nocardia brasiliensis]